MICVECTHTVNGLYSKYKNDYIQLTICPNCSNVADKYIEYDNVILFIDIFLLKSQAYRHLCYNLLESTLTEGENAISESCKKNAMNGELWPCIRYTFDKYKKISRMILLMVLFEVYLTWAYEEKQTRHSIIVNYIFDKEIYVQYFFFILKIVLEVSVLHFLTQFFFIRCFRWGIRENIQGHGSLKKTRSFYKTVLLVTVLVSGSIKLFPILMLIWPYDTRTSTAIIYPISIVNTMEALHIVTKCSYIKIFSVLMISMLLRAVISKVVIGYLISCISGMDFNVIINSEISNFKEHLRKIEFFGCTLVDTLYGSIS